MWYKLIAAIFAYGAYSFIASPPTFLRPNFWFRLIAIFTVFQLTAREVSKYSIFEYFQVSTLSLAVVCVFIGWILHKREVKKLGRANSLNDIIRVSRHKIIRRESLPSRRWLRLTSWLVLIYVIGTYSLANPPEKPIERIYIGPNKINQESK